MKHSLLLAIITILTACQADDPKHKKTKEKTEVEIRALLQEQTKLLNKKHQLEKQLNHFASTSKVDPSGQMKIIFEERQQAILNLQTIRNTHPNLQKLNEKLKSWQGHHRSAIASKKNSQAQQARKKVLEINAKIHTLSQELPAIREAEDRITRSEKALAELRRSLAEKTPKGKNLIQEIKTIEQKLATFQ